MVATLGGSPLKRMSSREAQMIAQHTFIISLIKMTLPARQTVAKVHTSASFCLCSFVYLSLQRYTQTEKELFVLFALRVRLISGGGTICNNTPFQKAPWLLMNVL